MHAACCRHKPAPGPVLSLKSAKKLCDAPRQRGRGPLGRLRPARKLSMTPLPPSSLVFGAIEHHRLVAARSCRAWSIEPHVKRATPSLSNLHVRKEALSRRPRRHETGQPLLVITECFAMLDMHV